MDEEVQPLATDEEVADLEEQLRRGNMMRALSASEPWKHLIVPYLYGAKKAALNAWRTEAQRHEEFIASRQCYNTIDALEAFITNTIKAGDIAHARLYPEKRPDDG